jgi:hypothetical protein
VPSVEAPPHNAGEVSSFLSTTSKLRCVRGRVTMGKIMTRFEIVPLSEVPTDSSCEEKARLATEYNVTTAAFSEAVKQLHQRIGTSPKKEYTRLTQISNEARVQSEQAQLALEKHIAAHGC